MSIRNLEWTKGAPDRLEPGMVLLWPDYTLEVIGTEGIPDYSAETLAYVAAWAWPLKPHTLEWMADMAAAHGVGR